MFGNKKKKVPAKYEKVDALIDNAITHLEFLKVILRDDSGTRSDAEYIRHSTYRAVQAVGFIESELDKK